MNSFIRNPYMPSIQYPDGIYEFLSPLPSVLRSACLGLLAGLSPTIIVQTQDELEAGSLWDLKYKFQLYTDLTELRKTLPISISTISAMARNVFIKRHTLQPCRLSYDIFLKQRESYGLINQLTNEDTMCSPSYQILESYSELTSLYRTVGDIPHYDYTQYNAINAIIDKHNTEDSRYLITTEKWRNMACEMLEHIRWVVAFCSGFNYDKDLIKVIINELFLPAILPESFITVCETENYSKLLPLYQIATEFVWNVEHELEPAQPLSQGDEPCTESFDLVASPSFLQNIITTNWQMPIVASEEIVTSEEEEVPAL